MQIQFDPRDRNQCVAVLGAILAAHGDFPGFADRTPQTARFESADPTAATQFPDEPTNEAAAAFEAPPLPPVAVPVAPRGDIDDADDEPHAAVPVQAPGDDPDEEPGNAAPPVSPAEHTAVATTLTPPPAPSSVETDTNGLPWDERIHSGPDDKRPKNADGSWRKRRGVDDETVARVEAELRQVMGAGGNAANVAGDQAPPAPAAAAPTAAPTPPVPMPPDAGTASGPDVATTADSVPPAPPVAATPAPAPAPTPAAEPAGELTFPALMRQITALQSAGTLTVQGTNDIAVSLGLTSVRDLVHRPDMVASFAALLPEQAS